VEAPLDDLRPLLLTRRYSELACRVLGRCSSCATRADRSERSATSCRGAPRLRRLNLTSERAEDPEVAQKLRKGSGDRTDYLKLFALGMLHMGQNFPAAFTGVAIPFMYRQQGLDLAHYWMFALPLVPMWLKWIIAIGVDNHGRRKIWIIWASMAAVTIYAVLAFTQPSLQNMGLVVALLTLAATAIAFQDAAIDGYAAESMTSAERPIGTSIIIYMAVIAGMMGSASVALIDLLGWRATLLSAAGLLIVVIAPALLRRANDMPEQRRTRIESGRRASLREMLGRSENRLILVHLLVFGFSTSLVSSMVAPLLADRGLSLSDFGIATALSIIVGIGAGSFAAPVLIHFFGHWRAAAIGAVPLLLEGIVLWYLSAFPLPGMVALTTMLSLASFGSSITMFVVNTTRFRWVSLEQACIDYSVQSSMLNLGAWAGGTASGFIASTVGWSLYFPLTAGANLAVAVLYLVTYESINRRVVAREMYSYHPRGRAS